MHMMHQKTLWQCTQYHITQLSKCEAHQHPYVKINKEVQKMTEFWMGYIVVKQQSDMHNKNSF